MNQSLANKLVLCDLDNLLLGPDGNLTQVVRDVLQLFSSRGGRFTVFSQRTPKAVRAILGSVRLSAPALRAAAHWPIILRTDPVSRCAALPGRMPVCSPACPVRPVWALPCRCRMAPPACCA